MNFCIQVFDDFPVRKKALGLLGIRKVERTQQ